MIKREAHTPTTDQSEDSGVDVSAVVACDNSGRGPYYKRTRSDDDDDDGCPTAAKSSRTDVPAALLSVNMAMGTGGKTTASTAIGCPPFRPWSSDESSSEVGLRLFHDIRNVDRILTLTQRHRESTPPPTEPQPLDLTNGRRRRATPAMNGDITTKHRIAYNAHQATKTIATTSVDANVVATDATVAAIADTTETTAVANVPISTTVTAAATATTTTTTTRYSKNMSRARRIEANARERSRVHTISAAFETLRATIPSYSRNQKLSKLSTIRIASAYILAMSRLLDMDYSAGQDRPSVEECMNNITGIIHMEGKARKRKDDQ